MMKATHFIEQYVTKPEYRHSEEPGNISTRFITIDYLGLNMADKYSSLKTIAIFKIKFKKLKP